MPKAVTNRFGSLTVASYWIEYLLDAAGQLGADLEPELHRLGLDREQLENGGDRIPMRVEHALLCRALELTGDDYFGLHMGELVRPRFMGELGYASMSSAHLGDAVDLMIPFFRVTAEFASLEKREDDGRLALVWHSSLDDVEGARHRVETLFASAVTFGRWITGTERDPEAVYFRHAAPADTGEYRRIFRCPVYFGAGESALVLDRELLSLPLRDADPEVHRIMRARIQHAMTNYRARDNLLHKVRAEIQRQMPQRPPQLESVAEALAMKPWTLRRRLRAQDTDFSTLLDAERQQLAQDWLLYSDRPISRIAADLGYSEQSAFNRAFRRWFGCTPLSYRENGGKGDHSG